MGRLALRDVPGLILGFVTILFIAEKDVPLTDTIFFGNTGQQDKTN